jgi:hypothetical protein
VRIREEKNWNRKSFYSSIQKYEHAKVDKEILDATYDFTFPSNLMKQNFALCL